MKFDKSKVYTALNADELKVGDKVILADTISTLKTSVEREENIVIISRISDEDIACRFCLAGCGGAYCLAYLVERAERAEEKKWRPYKNCDEMIADFKKRFNVDWADYEMPLIWLEIKNFHIKSLVCDFAESAVNVYCGDAVCLTSLLNDFTYLDGSPCGMEE